MRLTAVSVQGHESAFSGASCRERGQEQRGGLRDTTIPSPDDDHGPGQDVTHSREIAAFFGNASLVHTLAPQRRRAILR